MSDLTDKTIETEYNSRMISQLAKIPYLQGNDLLLVSHRQAGAGSTTSNYVSRQVTVGALSNTLSTAFNDSFYTKAQTSSSSELFDYFSKLCVDVKDLAATQIAKALADVYSTSETSSASQISVMLNDYVGVRNHQTIYGYKHFARGLSANLMHIGSTVDPQIRFKAGTSTKTYTARIIQTYENRIQFEIDNGSLQYSTTPTYENNTSASLDIPTLGTVLSCTNGVKNLLSSYIPKTDITNVLGKSTTLVASQKLVTDLSNAVKYDLAALMTNINQFKATLCADIEAFKREVRATLVDQQKQINQRSLIGHTHLLKDITDYKEREYMGYIRDDISGSGSGFHGGSTAIFTAKYNGVMTTLQMSINIGSVSNCGTKKNREIYIVRDGKIILLGSVGRADTPYHGSNIPFNAGDVFYVTGYCQTAHGTNWSFKGYVEQPVTIKSV